MAGSKEVQGTTLVSCGNYEERASVTPLARPRGRVELRVDSLLATARDPHVPRVRYRVTLDRQGLLRLRSLIDSALINVDEHAEIP